MNNLDFSTSRSLPSIGISAFSMKKKNKYISNNYNKKKLKFYRRIFEILNSLNLKPQLLIILVVATTGLPINFNLNMNYLKYEIINFNLYVINLKFVVKLFEEMSTIWFSFRKFSIFISEIN